MVAKQGWRLLWNPNASFSRLFKAKYFPSGNFLNSRLGSNPSLVWRSIWKAHSILAAGFRWRIGNGSHINVWSDLWLPNNNEFKPITPRMDDLIDIRV